MLPAYLHVINHHASANRPHPLALSSGDETEIVRRGFARRLVQLQELLEKLVNPKTKEQAAEALCRLHEQPLPSSRLVSREAVIAAAAFSLECERAVRSWIRIEQDLQVKSVLIRTLLFAREAESVNLLVALLEHPSPLISRAAVFALAHSTDNRAKIEIDKIIENPGHALRSWAEIAVTASSSQYGDFKRQLSNGVARAA